MPTIATFLGYRVAIYPNDHRPTHVHVMGRGCEAVFVLDCPGGPPHLRESYGFSRKDIAPIQRELGRLLDQLCTDWDNIHGTASRRI